jgi:hypothetical protein
METGVKLAALQTRERGNALVALLKVGQVCNLSRIVRQFTTAGECLRRQTCPTFARRPPRALRNWGAKDRPLRQPRPHPQ